MKYSEHDLFCIMHMPNSDILSNAGLGRGELELFLKAKVANVCGIVMSAENVNCFSTFCK